MNFTSTWTRWPGSWFISRRLRIYGALGLDIPADADQSEHVEFTTPSGFTLMWDPLSTIAAFECDGPAAVDETYAAMVGAGEDGHKEPWDAFWGQRYAALRDPDGTGVDLFARCPPDIGQSSR